MKSFTLINKKTAEYILLWCALKYGPSMWSYSGRIQIKTKNSMICWGRYYSEDDGICNIYVNFKKHKNIKELIDTIIHEYIHHKQPIHLKYNNYLLNNEYDETNHPFELEANFYAFRDARECYNWLKLK